MPQYAIPEGHKIYTVRGPLEDALVDPKAVYSDVEYRQYLMTDYQRNRFFARAETTRDSSRTIDENIFAIAEDFGSVLHSAIGGPPAITIHEGGQLIYAVDCCEGKKTEQRFYNVGLSQTIKETDNNGRIEEIFDTATHELVLRMVPQDTAEHLSMMRYKKGKLIAATSSQYGDLSPKELEAWQNLHDMAEVKKSLYVPRRQRIRNAIDTLFTVK